ncbi:MAG: tRNA pseudouridine(55) synthase TruB [Actinomycetota bacterium]|jgi:tRNA pseudouridine55 synthase|nr:tRNA pseudouridine(55) synthase TruB [Actinomycetota bacterium]
MAKKMRVKAGSRRIALTLIDKEVGLTSNSVVGKVRYVSGNSRVGHSGTLDPFASGLMVVALGQGTRLLPFLHNTPKRYQARLILGACTDTGDLTGEFIEKRAVPDSSETLLHEILSSQLGESMQVPPAYSARKVDGVRSYQLAREGRAVELEASPINIYEISGAWVSDEVIDFEVSCSRGTYVRTLGEDIAKGLGTLGYLSQLRRIESDGFSVSDASPLPNEKDDLRFCDSKIIERFDSLGVDQAMAKRLINGVEVDLNDLESDRDYGDGLTFVYSRDAVERPETLEDLIGLFEIVEGKLCPRVTFPQGAN